MSRRDILQQFLEMGREYRDRLKAKADKILEGLESIQSTGDERRNIALGFLRTALSGELNTDALERLSLEMLSREMNIRELVVEIGAIMESMELDRDTMENLQKLTSIYLAILSEHISRTFLKAVIEATGMSEQLLKNFAKLHLDRAKSSLSRGRE